MKINASKFPFCSQSRRLPLWCESGLCSAVTANTTSPFSVSGGSWCSLNLRILGVLCRRGRWQDLPKEAHVSTQQPFRGVPARVGEGGERDSAEALLLCSVWSVCSRLCMEINISPTVYCTSGRRLMTFHVLRPSPYLNICISPLLCMLLSILHHMLYMLPSCSSDHRANCCISAQSVYLSPLHILVSNKCSCSSLGRCWFTATNTSNTAHLLMHIMLPPVHLWKRRKWSYHLYNHTTRQTSFLRRMHRFFLFDLILFPLHMLREGKAWKEISSTFAPQKEMSLIKGFYKTNICRAHNIWQCVCMHWWLRLNYLKKEF